MVNLLSVSAGQFLVLQRMFQKETNTNTVDPCDRMNQTRPCCRNLQEDTVQISLGFLPRADIVLLVTQNLRVSVVSVTCVLLCAARIARCTHYWL